MLTLLVFLPLGGGLLAWGVGRRLGAARAVALLTCAAELALSLALWVATRPGGGRALLVTRAAWLPELGVSYHLALDSLSLLLLVLTGLLGLVAVAASWRETEERSGGFFLALLSVLSGVAGVFLARDLLLFYFFWEFMLIPMYFLISVWGHTRRVYSAVKFFLFTFITSLFMLASLLGLVFLHHRATGVVTFDAAALAGTPLSPQQAAWLLAGFFVAFATKLPAVPFHTWLADAHTDAPTGGSVLLAGLLLKTGAYGLLRFAVPLFPQAATAWAHAAGWLGVVSILYGALLAFGQRDFKRVVAYTSVSHMGFVLLGIAAGNAPGLQGAVVQMLAHGLGTGALFVLAGSLQERTGTRDLDRIGGLWSRLPRWSGFTLYFALAALGLPGLGSFIAEFLVLVGAFLFNPWLAAAGALGFVLSVVYAVRLLQESVYGPSQGHAHRPDLNAREVVTLGVLAAALLWLGLWPQPVLQAARRSLAPVSASSSRMAGLLTEEGVGRGRP